MKMRAKLFIGFINITIIIIFVSLLALTSTAKDTAPSCSSQEHRCGDGTCVGSELVCDGHVDCTDGAGGDEINCQPSTSDNVSTLASDSALSLLITINRQIASFLNRSNTQSTECGKNQWQCNDGSCIASNGKCDRVVDCSDGSDEALALCRFVSPLNTDNFIPDDDTETQPAPPIIEFNYYPEEDTPQENTTNTSPECGRLIREDEPVEGMKSIEGLPTWSAVIYKKTASITKQLCVGSLVRNNIIISAAQCFWRYKLPLVPSQYAVAVGKLRYPEWEDPMPLPEVQKSDVAKITIPNRYQADHANFQDDIALVVVTDAFEYNAYVGPVCLDFDLVFDKKQLTTGNIGQISGWWRAENDNATTKLQVRKLPYVDIDECVKNATSLLNYLTSDKVCAGYHRGRILQQGSVSEGTTAVPDILPPSSSVQALLCLALKGTVATSNEDDTPAFCRSDVGVAGAGLTFPDRVQSEERYYLRGVVSIIPLKQEWCFTDFNSFTKITKHEQFLRAGLDDEPRSLETEKSVNVSTHSKPVVRKCLLPTTLPTHGTYVTNATRVVNVTGDGDGESYELVTLSVTCERGYGVLGPSSVKCYNGFWPEKTPKCVRMCPLKTHPSVQYRCLLSGAREGLRACREHEPPGAVVNPRCREPHYYSTAPLPFMHCQSDARWDHVVRCKPDCGRRTPEGQGLVFGGTNAKQGELPWHAGIYDKTTRPYMQVCGGSLISNELIISAAHCFWKGRKPLAESRFAAAVGKLYRPWNDKKDDAQKSDVKRIHLPPRFRGADANFQDDIAVVVVAHAFEYRNYVRPVCLSFDSNFERRQLQTINKGKVAGWGLTSANGKASPVLQVVDLPYVEVDTCIAKSPPAFTQFITSDKICAGTKQPNSALCHGDSGGGLVFSATDSYIERYYLRGVVSTAPGDENNNLCNIATYTSFTQILQHEDFIVPLLTDF